METLSTPGDTARRLGVCVATLRRWRKQGLLGPEGGAWERTVGGAYRYRVERIRQLRAPERRRIAADMQARLDAARARLRLRRSG